MSDTVKESRSDESRRQRLFDLCGFTVENLKDTDKLSEMFEELKKSPGMAQDVWSCDSMPIFLLQEVITPYTILNTNKFGEAECHRLYTVLNILQILVSDSKIKKVFVDARFPYYIYRYLVISDSDSKYETLRISALGVIASLLQNGDQYIHKQLKTTEIVPLLLKIIDLGSEASQLLSANVFGLIIGSDEGLNYACQTFDRFSAINLMFNSLASQGVSLGSTRLIKAALRIYIRLCAKPHIRALLSSKKPDVLFTDEASSLISSDSECKELFKTFSEMIC
ncbi:putative Rcd1-like protein [Encephalitozoon intestinalis ATCC 50506]|uniref:Rcd1-like protein n=1 Tax=Encephalitozoon intestinalis (strain ATCC 50506) TaxID=876142 RepID=E0S5A3_ENCIT|nr:putative Rcd1-like protein [Encephalitozoon intestinalis ATCC 50506]ADM10888.2 putative Rcd1-like protein [Encephalitozoon intestinalis ATCC 50506]UTX44520.1 putative Rcd1-like protein [Encephalitozoon intestinalis]